MNAKLNALKAAGVECQTCCAWKDGRCVEHPDLNGHGCIKSDGSGVCTDHHTARMTHWDCTAGKYEFQKLVTSS